MREGGKEGGSVPICIFISTSSPNVRRRGEGEEEKSPQAMPVSSSQRGGGVSPICSTDQ